MRILHIHPSLASGGIEAMICGLANEMAKTEDVTVCSIFEPKETDIFYQKLSKDVKVTSCHKTKEGFSIKEIFYICWVIMKGKYDVVNLHGFMYYYICAIALSVFSKTKFFYTVHSNAEMENGYWDLKFIKIKRFLFKHDIVHPITISKSSKKSFTKYYHTDSKQINNGIATPVIDKMDVVNPFRITGKTNVFLHPGRISKAKNQIVLCKVFKRLINEGYDVMLLIAGGTDNNYIMNSLSPFFCDRIQYLGMRNDVPQIMNHCDAMCLSSIWEGLPITLLESLAVGCIPICTPVGGIVDVVRDGTNGILSKSSLENDYYQAILRFLTMNTADRELMKIEARKSFSDYKIENTAQGYLMHYQDIIQ